MTEFVPPCQWKQLSGHYVHARALKYKAEEKQLVTRRDVKRGRKSSEKS